MNTQQTSDMVDDLSEEDFLATYGPADSSKLDIARKSSSDFQPWHHPVKQIVRTKQWLALTKKLLKEDFSDSTELKYFTLPGPDLLDVKTLIEACLPHSVKIDYFGFNSGATSDDKQAAQQSDVGTFLYTESALLQSGSISPSAEILPDRLEDIAIPSSHASTKLGQRAPFDIINLDICDHLAYIPKGRTVTAFNALESLLAHQLRARTPWLLFVTTRAEPDLLGNPGFQFTKAITENLSIAGSGFKDALAECLDIDSNNLTAELNKKWNTKNLDFLKLFTVGLGKFLLQFFHSQPSLPANVELASSYTYRVYGESPDMLALAFRITPEKPRTFPGGVRGIATFPDLEPERAVYVANQAKKMWNIDEVISTHCEIRDLAVKETEDLLKAASYSIPDWRKWLLAHKIRPLQV